MRPLENLFWRWHKQRTSLFSKIGTSQEFRDRLDEAQENFRFSKDEWAQIFYNNEQSIWDSFWAWMPFILLIFIWIFLCEE